MHRFSTWFFHISVGLPQGIAQNAILYHITVYNQQLVGDIILDEICLVSSVFIKHTSHLV